MKIKLLPSLNYGRQEYKPLCETGKRVAELLGRTFITAKNIVNLKKLGFEVTILGED